MAPFEVTEEDSEVSVVLATRNRAASLSTLLRGLTSQLDAPPFEVIVADNGSTDGTAQLLEGGFPGLRLRSVRVDAPGKGRALNAAIRVGTGSLLVFTDDDVEPDPYWIAELHAASERYPEAKVFGGKIEVDRDAVPKWVLRSHNFMRILTSEHECDTPDGVYPHGRYPFGPNMAVRREALTHSPAPYPENIGPGTLLPVGDEGAFLIRISAPQDRDRRYVETARVRHALQPHYLAFANAMRRSFTTGFTEARIGIPQTPVGIDPTSRLPFVGKVFARIRACRSVRELICVCVRQVGYVKGVRARVSS